ncbi:hypothetical protein K502DRAFT_323200 [Neoconidiobolus thromboides FSU 785]|nr:hypothetical protein K502DRAFT_323200 [Neoconidiobolus thromboides FSU 785]
MSQKLGRSHPQLQWVRASNGIVPPNAVQGGSENDGRPLFIARTMYKGSLIPGKTAPHLEGCLISFGGKEVLEKEYEVLVGDARTLQWKECYGRLQVQGFTPLEAGHEGDGLELFIAKTRLQSGEVLGKVSINMSNGMAFGYGAKELFVKDTDVYYVLTIPNNY